MSNHENDESAVPSQQWAELPIAAAQKLQRKDRSSTVYGAA
jgi:hypothetical protein